jgi:hypothetical protein
MKAHNFAHGAVCKGFGFEQAGSNPPGFMLGHAKATSHAQFSANELHVGVALRQPTSTCSGSKTLRLCRPGKRKVMMKLIQCAGRLKVTAHDLSLATSL